MTHPPLVRSVRRIKHGFKLPYSTHPVFASVGALILHLGPVGAGQCAKLVNNTLLAANLTAAQNALDASHALGLDRAALVQLPGARQMQEAMKGLTFDNDPREPAAAKR